MKWEGEEGSANVDDRRNEGGGGGGFGGLPIGGRGIGFGTVAIALVASLVFGVNPLTVLSLLTGGGGPVPSAPVSQGPAHAPPSSDREAQFVSIVLRSTEQVWEQVFQQGKASYQPPRLVLFRGATRTACGTGQSAMGPFYCPGDQQVYIDLDFFDTLKRQLGAPGEFAQAYVVAHEVGHHVQNLMGISDKVDAARRNGSERQANALSVRLELQADCFAGIWSSRSQQAKHWLDQSDIDAALNAASKIGDDTLQRQSRGTVVPESFTHGSSAQRVQWFKRGLQSGQVADCNTFESNAL